MTMQPLYTSLLRTLLRNLVRNSGDLDEEAEQQAEASVNVPYPSLQIVNSVPFCLFSLYLYPLCAPSLFSHSTIPSFSSDQLFVLPR